MFWGFRGLHRWGRRPPERVVRETLSPLLHRQGFGALCRAEDPRARPLNLTSYWSAFVVLYLLAVPTWNVGQLFDFGVLPVVGILLASFGVVLILSRQVTVSTTTVKIAIVLLISLSALGILTLAARVIFDGWSSAGLTVGGFAALARIVR